MTTVEALNPFYAEAQRIQELSEGLGPAARRRLQALIPCSSKMSKRQRNWRLVSIGSEQSKFTTTERFYWPKATIFCGLRPINTKEEV